MDSTDHRQNQNPDVLDFLLFLARVLSEYGWLRAQPVQAHLNGPSTIAATPADVVVADVEDTGMKVTNCISAWQMLPISDVRRNWKRNTKMKIIQNG